MDNTEFLKRFFQPSDSLKQIRQLVIYEDEFGEAHTIFSFEEQKVSEIIFDFSYVWIKKEI